MIANRRFDVGEQNLHFRRNGHSVELLLPVAGRDEIVDQHQKPRVERLPPPDNYLSVNQAVVDAIEVDPHQRPTTISDAFPRSAAARAASVGGTEVLKTKSSSVARFTPLTRIRPGSALTMRRAAIVALPAGRSVKITRAPVRASWSRIEASMSSGVIPIIDSTISLSAIPQIWPTAETRPPAKSPCPTTIARGFCGALSFASFMVFLEVLADIVRRRRLHAADEALVECFSGVDARVSQKMIQGDDLGYHRDVLARIEEDRDLGQLYLENRRRLHVEAGALDDRVLVPFLQLDDD